MTKPKSKDIWRHEALNNKRLLRKALAQCNLLEDKIERLNQVIWVLKEEIRMLKEETRWS